MTRGQKMIVLSYYLKGVSPKAVLENDMTGILDGVKSSEIYEYMTGVFNRARAVEVTRLSLLRCGICNAPGVGRRDGSVRCDLCWQGFLNSLP